MGFESGIVSEYWKSAVIVLLYHGKGGRTECKNNRGISLLIMVGIIYAGVLIYIFSNATWGLIDDEQFGLIGNFVAVDENV